MLWRTSEIVLSWSPDAGIKLAGDPAGDGGYQSPDTGETTYKP
jgi:hypothetical protein